MAYKYSFADNEIYSASDINAITKRLVTSGVADTFTDGVPYNVSTLNEMGKIIYTKGVVPEGCLTLKVVPLSDGKILINPGLAFFDDGSFIEIEDGGEEMPYVLGEVNYVYLKNNLYNMNISYPCCTTEEPDGDFVMLAEIDKGGNIEDKRTYAKGRLPGYQSIGSQILQFSEEVEFTLDGGSVYEKVVTFDIGANMFEYILAMDFADNSTKRHEVLSIHRISDSKTMSMFAKNDDNDALLQRSMYIYHDQYATRITADPTLVDGILTVKIYIFDPDRRLGKSGNIYKVPLNFLFI